MGGITLAHPDVVRGVIAGEWLRAGSVAVELGSITLRPHQVDAARRIRALLARAGGALLCDEVGLGKTYVALAVARASARPLVIAPASLREMWEDAAGKAAVAVRIVSTESLGRAGPARSGCDLVIVDEAHYCRSPAAKRYAALVSLTARTPVLLVSATPVHNKRSDVVALLSFFLGSAASELTDADLARYMVRRGQTEAGASLPRVRTAARLPVPHDSAPLDLLLALPPPVPPRDGGLAGALVTHTLVRLWASSEAALREGLRRRIAKAIALRVALEEGRYPTSNDLRSWTYGDGSVQLGFPSILSPCQSRDSGRMLESVREHERALSELLCSLPRESVADDARVDQLRAVRRRHPHEKIVAFSQFTDTVARLYRGIAPDGGVAMLTAAGARIAGGPISRAEALARFAPAACSAPEPPASEAISLLIATDLLSDGVNLQDAAVVVHLDLPWTAATLEQRVGRAARMGSPHREVFVYAMDPPAPSERLLRAEAIILRKAGLAAASVGASRIPPLFAPLASRPESNVESAEAIRRTLSAWPALRKQPARAETLCAAVAADRDAALVLTVVRGEPRLAVVCEGRVSACSALINKVAAMAQGEPAPAPTALIAAVVNDAKQWIERQLAASDAGDSPSGRSALAGRIGARLARCLARCPRHERSRYGQRIAALRLRLQRPFTLGVEREIEELLRDGEDDFVEQLARIVGAERPEAIDQISEIRAVLILRRVCHSEWEPTRSYITLP